MSEQDFEVLQEHDRVATRKIVSVVAVALITGALAVIVAALLLQAGAGSIRIDTVQPGHAQRPATVHIGQIKQTMIDYKAWGRELNARQHKELSTYRWIDKQNGLAQIPIDDAMDIVVQRAR